MFPSGVFQVPTRVVFGEHCVQGIGPAAAARGAKRALVASDRGVIGAGLVQPVLDSLAGAGVAATLFDGVEPDPSLEVIARAHELAEQEGCDLFIGVGGGSSMDTAKAAALLKTNPGDLRDYEGVDRFPNAPAPLFCVPTTVGTASEVTIFMVITDKGRRYKFPVGGTLLAPLLAFLDPYMVKGLPPQVTAATGMDALTHASECYLALSAHPISEGLSLHAIRLIGQHLRAAVANSDNIEVMGTMLMAASMAGMAFNFTRLGNVHAMAHPLGAYYHVPHGVANALLLPYVMEFNALAVPGKLIDIAVALGENVAGLPEMEAARRAPAAVRRLIADIGLPTRLRDLGVDQATIPQMAEDAMKSGNIRVNPRRTTINEIIALYERAY